VLRFSGGFRPVIASVTFVLQVNDKKVDNRMVNKIIISGGPGAGKSSLLEALKAVGFHCVPEVSRELIRSQVATNAECVPWKDLDCFARLCLDKMMYDYRSASDKSLVFFDRGIPDIIAYLRFGGLEAGGAFLAAARKYRYAADVFIAPPWEEIYVNDDERWQTFHEAAALYREICQVYKEFGYTIISLPLVPIAKRVTFTLTQLERIEVK
jgi:predicted ATPase